MTTKHTPGPWYVGSGTYECRNIYSVASVTDDEGFTYQPIVATAEDDGIGCWDANARLIAAAPDLLEALRSAVNDADAWGLADDECDWLPLARAAIARATGEQP
jgi:hypothetical protein